MSTNSAAPNGCEWRNPIDGSPCTFDPEQYRPRAFKGQRFCFAHRPDYDAVKSLQAVQQMMEEYRNSGMSLATFVFPLVPENKSNSLNVSRLVLTQCEFLGKYELECGGQPVDLSGAVFRQNVNLTHVNGGITLNSAHAHGDLKFQGTASGRIAMRGATCAGAVTLRTGGATPAPFASIDFRGTEFAEVPTLHPNLLPQDARFYGAKFKGNAVRSESEARHRALRVAFAENSDREMEGFFYTWEKRCHRRSLTQWVSWLPRAVSWLYDITSQYGRSYEYALAWLVGIQLAFGFGYSVASDRWTIPGEFDSTIATFTIGQVVRPFEIYSARAASSSVYQQLFSGELPSGGWVLATTIHSIVSLIIFALMLLAMRWRFRRE